MGGFDPTKYGAIPVQQEPTAEFDPTKYGAIPVKPAARTPQPAKAAGPLAPMIPTAQQAYSQGVQSASQQGTLGRGFAAVAGQIPAAIQAAEPGFLGGASSVSEALSNIPKGLAYEFQHPVDTAGMLLKAYGSSIAGPIYQGVLDKNAPASERASKVAEGLMNTVGVGTPIAQSAQAAGRGEYGKAVGTLIPAIAQAALGMKLPGDVQEGYVGAIHPETSEMLSGLKTAAGDTITPSMGTVVSHGGVPSFQRVVAGIPGGQALRDVGQTGITDAATAYTRAMVRVAADAGVKDLDASLAKYPVRDIGMRTQVVGDAIKQHAGTLYDSLDQAYTMDPKVFQPVAGSLSKWAEGVLKQSEFDRLMSASPEFSSGLRKSLQDLTTAEHLQPGATIQGQEVNLMANYRNARSDLKAIQMGAKSARDRMIAGQAVDQLDKAISDGFSKTGNPALNDLYQEANQKWRQGQALMELGQAIEPAYRNIEPEMQIGTQKRPTDLNVSRIVDALTELSKVPIRAKESRFAEAVPSAVDQQTIHQIANYLAKNEAAGGRTIAGQFGNLDVARAPGEAVTNPTKAAGAIGYVLRLPASGRILAFAMTNKAAAAATLEFLKAAPGTAHAAAAAARLGASMSQWESQ